MSLGDYRRTWTTEFTTRRNATMAAPEKTDTAADKPDTGTATTSTSTSDASTVAGRAAADKPAADPQRVVIEQAPAEPAVFYGEDGETPAPREHVKADYQPFNW